MFRQIMIGAAVLAAAGCASTDDSEAPAFNPAACVERDFTIYFAEGRHELSDDARRIIDLESRAIRGCRIDGVRIIGLSDAREGGDETARQLSVRRAEVLSDYLAQRASWPRSRFQLLATGARGAVTEEGLDVPVRNRARIIVAASAP